MGLFKIVEKLISVVSTLILARLLVPADFGLIAMAMSIVALTDLMTSFGFETALIHRRDADRIHFDTAWTYSVLFGLGVALAILMLAYPATLYFREPRLIGVLPVLALASVIQGFENIGIVKFRKELDFRSDFYVLLGKKFAGFVVTIVLALLFRSFWALVIGTVFSRIIGVIISYWLHPYRPRFCLEGGKDLFSYSKWLVMSNFIHFLESRSVDYIVGRSVGAVGLGLFGIAQQLASMPSSELVAPLNRAALPAYSAVAADPVRLKQEVLRVIGMVCLFIFPLGVGLACLAKSVVFLLLGEKWQGVVALLQILSVYGIVVALNSNIHQVYLARGTPRIITLVSAGMIFVMIPGLYLGVDRLGVLGAAWVFLIYAALSAPVVHGVFFWQLRVTISEYLRVIWRPIFASAVMAGSILGLPSFSSVGYGTQAALFELLLGIMVGATSFVVSVYVLWYICGTPDSAERVIRDRILLSLRT